MEWDDFLRKNADDFGLSSEQTKVFLLLLSEKYQNITVDKIVTSIANSLEKNEYSIKKLATEIFSKFTLSKQNPNGCASIQTKGKGKLKILREWLTEKFDNENSIIESEETSPVADNEIIDRIDWQNICKKILDKKPLRRNITGNSIELNIFVKVGVNKLIQQQNSNTQEEYYSYDRFFSEVIENNDLRKLAIIGEPGSGKTTLLERIAKFSNTTATIIWIDLQRLKQKTIEEYLRQDWLKINLDLISQDLIDPTPELEKELAKLFNSGEVLLILDGVDEMAEKNAIDALDRISENITGWLAKAKIILSCRQNVWAENLNTIKDFQVYQTLNFSYGDLKEDSQDQVEDFINQYFSEIDKFDLGLQLRQKLNEIKYQRVKDLVKNPLRLSLLCQCWQLKQGELPQTKAEIYTLFVNSSYDWKAREHSISEEDQEILHQKLGELAKNGIDQDQPIFEFSKKYIVKLISERFFKLAVDLHWLISIDINVNTNEKIYAFIHKTFQEYFASLVIDDWHFFLNHNNQNPNPFVKFNDQDCIYRIFESKWEEVILLWFGSNTIDADTKESFMNCLVDFQDGCQQKFIIFDDPGIYEHRAYLLAKKSISEFKNYSKNNEIQQLVRRPMGYFPQNPIPKKKIYFDPYEKLTNVEICLLILIQALENTELYTPEIIQILAEGSKPAIKLLINIIRDTKDDYIRRSSIMALGMIGMNYPEVVNLMIDMINNNQNDFEIETIAEALANTKINYEKVCKVLLDLSVDLEKNSSHQISYCLALIMERNPLKSIILDLKKLIPIKINSNSDVHIYLSCYDILWHSTQNLSYPEFYQIWYDHNSQIVNLKKQYNNLLLQLKPTKQTYPVIINVQETEETAITQEIVNQIYQTVLPQVIDIPQVNNTIQIKRLLPTIKHYTQTKNLALIMSECQPHPQLLKLCETLENDVHIVWITDQQIEPPMRGFPPDQVNLINIIQNWINEIEY